MNRFGIIFGGKEEEQEEKEEGGRSDQNDQSDWSFRGDEKRIKQNKEMEREIKMLKEKIMKQ